MNHLANHLWQSTVFAVLTPDGNDPAPEPGAASLLALAGGFAQIPDTIFRPGQHGRGRRKADRVSRSTRSTVLRVSQYFAPAPTFATVAPPGAVVLGAAMGAIWAGGFPPVVPLVRTLAGNPRCD